jgi:hypothetical protein
MPPFLNESTLTRSVGAAIEVAVSTTAAPVAKIPIAAILIASTLSSL